VVKVLMFPLAMHKGAREQCIAVVCDKKGFDDLEGGYTSGNQCAEGAKLVDDSVALLSGKGITGTPTYIFADGKFQSGVLEANALRGRLGLPVTAAPPAGPKKPAPAAPPAAPATKAPAGEKK
jgi:thiol:disulfide interchange protein DsbC